MKRKASKDLSGPNDNVQVSSDVTIIDSEGDLQLDLDDHGKPYSLLVNRTVLRLASPIFRAMFAQDSSFQESAKNVTNKDGIQVVQLREDPSQSMEVLMNVIHLQGHRVPSHVSFCQLYGIARICDKYDLSRSLGHWGETWMKPFVKVFELGIMGKLLFVATALRCLDSFPRITKYITLNIVPTAAGDLHVGNEKNSFTEGVPKSVIGRHHDH